MTSKKAAAAAKPLELVPTEAEKKPAAQALVPSGSNSPAELMRAAAAAGMTPDMIRELMQLQRDHEANEARKVAVAAMADFKANPPEILKQKLVSFTNNKGELVEYKHASLFDVTNAIVEGLAKHGFSHRWRTTQAEGGLISVTCILTHRFGHVEETELKSLPDKSGGKNDIQAVASTVSYLQRYTLLAATGLATKDMDDDGARSALTPDDFITEAQEAQLLDMIESTGANKAGFLEYMRVEHVHEILASEFQVALNALKAKERAVREGRQS